MAIDSHGVAWIAYRSQPKMTSAMQDRHIDGVIVRYDLESGACELVFESLQNMPPAHGLSILPTAQGTGQDDLYAISHPAAEPRSTLYEWSGERGRARPTRPMSAAVLRLPVVMMRRSGCYKTLSRLLICLDSHAD